MKKNAVIILITFCLTNAIIGIKNNYAMQGELEKQVSWWRIQSIDTMKYSRDLSREKINDPEFDKIIDIQVKNIADLGATYVSLGTPYDEEFVPMLHRWVNAARKYNLKVWFRGNFSGWEKWFGYALIDRKTHIEKTDKFIESNSDLFENGDIFSACPECENGGPGDPRKTGDIEGYREFLLEEYKVTKVAFNKVGKNVASNYASMNADVAKLVMDNKTTKAMDGIVVIDHYVLSPQQLALDVEEVVKNSGGEIVLGEFGAPILDIHGQMTETEQAEWIKLALIKLTAIKSLIGVNYWVNVGGPTELWDSNGNPKKAVEEISKIFKPGQLEGLVKDEIGRPLARAVIESKNRKTTSDLKGKFAFPSIDKTENVNVSAADYLEKDFLLTNDQTSITLVRKNPDFIYRFMKFIQNLRLPSF